MSVVTALRAIGDNSASSLPRLTGTLEDVGRANLIRHRQISELTDLIETYQRVVPWHRRPLVDDPWLRARQTSLRFYRTESSAAVILRYYDPGYSPES